MNSDGWERIADEKLYNIKQQLCLSLLLKSVHRINKACEPHPSSFNTHLVLLCFCVKCYELYKMFQTEPKYRTLRLSVPRSSVVHWLYKHCSLYTRSGSSSTRMTPQFPTLRLLSKLVSAGNCWYGPGPSPPSLARNIVVTLHETHRLSHLLCTSHPIKKTISERNSTITTTQTMPEKKKVFNSQDKHISSHDNSSVIVVSCVFPLKTQLCWQQSDVTSAINHFLHLVSNIIIAAALDNSLQHLQWTLGFTSSLWSSGLLLLQSILQTRYW